MQTEKFIRRAQTFLGDDGTVDRTVVIQKRPITAILAGVGGFVAVAVLLSLIGITNVIIVGALGGAALGGIMASMTQNFYLVGVGNKVQMLKLATWTGQPESIVRTLNRPLNAELSKGLITKSVLLDGEKYLVSKLFIDELDALTTIHV